MYVGKLFDIQYKECYDRWNSRIQSLSYVFTQDLKQLEDDFTSSIKIENNQQPNLLSLYFQEKLCLETMTILYGIWDYLSYWQKNWIENNNELKAVKHLILKYNYFLIYEKSQYKKLFLNQFSPK